MVRTLLSVAVLVLVALAVAAASPALQMPAILKPNDVQRSAAVSYSMAVMTTATAATAPRILACTPADNECLAYRDFANPLAATGASNCTDSGACYVFERIAGTANTWKQTAKVQPPVTGFGFRFGASAAMSADGEVFVVGSPGESGCSAVEVGGDPMDVSASFGSGSCRARGAVYVFHRNSASNQWVLQAYLKAGTRARNTDSFGYAVSLSNDAKLLAIGSPKDDSCATGIDSSGLNTCSNSGAVYLFSYALGQWQLLHFVKPPVSSSPNSEFGRSVAFTSDNCNLVIGAPMADSCNPIVNYSSTGCRDAGAAFLYSISSSLGLKFKMQLDRHADSYSNSANLPGSRFGWNFVAHPARSDIIAVGVLHDSTPFVPEITGGYVSANHTGGVLIYSVSDGSIAHYLRPPITPTLQTYGSNPRIYGTYFGDGVGFFEDMVFVSAPGDDSCLTGVVPIGEVEGRFSNSCADTGVQYAYRFNNFTQRYTPQFAFYGPYLQNNSWTTWEIKGGVDFVAVGNPGDGSCRSGTNVDPVVDPDYAKSCAWSGSVWVHFLGDLPSTPGATTAPIAGAGVGSDIQIDDMAVVKPNDPQKWMVFSTAMSSATSVPRFVSCASKACQCNRGNPLPIAGFSDCTEAGACYVFDRISLSRNLWKESFKIMPPVTGRRFWFGVSVQMSADGTRMVVGSPGESGCSAQAVGGDMFDVTVSTNAGTCRQRGAVYVYFLNGDLQWELEAYLKPTSSNTVFDHFGDSVSMSSDGTIVAVGAPGDSSCAVGIDGAGSNACPDSGAVYVFGKFLNQWKLVNYIKPSAVHPEAAFGSAISLTPDGMHLVVGAPLSSSCNPVLDFSTQDCSFAGAAFLYSVSQSSGVRLVSQLDRHPDSYTSNITINGTKFGSSVWTPSNGLVAIGHSSDTLPFVPAVPGGGDIVTGHAGSVLIYDATDGKLLHYVRPPVRPSSDSNWYGFGAGVLFFAVDGVDMMFVGASGDDRCLAGAVSIKSIEGLATQCENSGIIYAYRFDAFSNQYVPEFAFVGPGASRNGTWLGYSFAAGSEFVLVGFVGDQSCIAGTNLGPNIETSPPDCEWSGSVWVMTLSPVSPTASSSSANTLSSAASTPSPPTEATSTIQMISAATTNQVTSTGVPFQTSAAGGSASALIISVVVITLFVLAALVTIVALLFRRRRSEDRALSKGSPIELTSIPTSPSDPTPAAGSQGDACYRSVREMTGHPSISEDNSYQAMPVVLPAETHYKSFPQV